MQVVTDADYNMPSLMDEFLTDDEVFGNWIWDALLEVDDGLMRTKFNHMAACQEAVDNASKRGKWTAASRFQAKMDGTELELGRLIRDKVMAFMERKSEECE